MKNIKKYNCLLCNKFYTSRQSYWNHTNKYHKIEDTHITINKCPNDSHNINNISNKKIFNCKYCNKIFNHCSSKSRHEQQCNNNSNNKFIELKKENEYIKNNILELKDNILELKNQTINNNTINNTNCNNNIINNKYKINFIINKPGSENIADLTEDEIKQILLKNGEGITKFIELTNFNNNLPSNHSFCTTNLKSKYLDVFNNETKTIDKDNKKYFFDNLLRTSVDGIKKLIELHKSENFIIKNNNIITEMLNSSIEFSRKFLNDSILKELFNKFELISYNNKKLIQDTWIGKHNDSEINIKIKKLILEIKECKNNKIIIKDIKKEFESLINKI